MEKKKVTIPRDKWGVNSLRDENGNMCFLGHCLSQLTNVDQGLMLYESFPYDYYPLADSLRKSDSVHHWMLDEEIAEQVADANDSYEDLEERLEDIKRVLDWYDIDYFEVEVV